jgi:diguanylate cyclase (GGDEF)-like protein
MSDANVRPRVHRPLNQARALALIFALLGILVTTLLTAHWLLVLEPTLRTHALGDARVLAQTQAQGLEQILGQGRPEERRAELETALDQLLLVREEGQDLPFIRRVTMEIDYESIEAPPGSLDLVRGAEWCPDCLISRVPLYDPQDQQLVGIATFYASPQSLQTLLGGFRAKLMLGGGFLLLLIGAAWFGTGRLLRRLALSESNLRSLFETAPFPMVLHLDRAPTLSRANQAAVEYLDLREAPKGGLTSATWRALIDSGLPAEGENHRERLLPFRDGTERWALVSAIPLKLADGPSHLVSLVDVSQLKAYQKELHLASITDGLTGLYNRRYLFLRLAEEIERAARGTYRFSIALLDLDHFKRVNDTFGHRTGDEALVRTANAMRGAIRGLDLAGRYGGEEFLVILPDTGATEARAVAERIRAAVKALSWPELGLRLTLSGGVCGHAGADIDSLLECADRRLYAAKAGGRDRIVAEEPGDPPSA